MTVSQTGSVRVLGGDPKALAAMPAEEEAGGGGGGGAGLAEDGGGGGGRLDWMKGEDVGVGVGVEETGMEARGGLGGRAGRTVEGADWIEEWIRFSISSMSDWDEE